jgi:hypothetical protein
MSQNHVRYELVDTQLDGLLMKTKYHHKLEKHYEKIIRRAPQLEGYICLRVILVRSNLLWFTPRLEDFQKFRQNFVTAYIATEEVE